MTTSENRPVHSRQREWLLQDSQFARKSIQETPMHRRDWLSRATLGMGAASMPLVGAAALAGPQAAVVQKLAPVRIADIQTILTAPAGIRLIVVKVITNEAGLYGLGCATFTQRA